MNYKSKLNEIKAFVFDVDGVLTDGSLILLPDGSMTRTMNTRDGYALQLAVKKDVPIGVITGGKDQMIKSRMRYLGITDIYLASQNKLEDFQDFLDRYQLKPEEVAFMGDDIPDLEVMKMVGLACCPKDAAPEIQEISLYISQKEGGKGCVRDIIEQWLKVHGKWTEDVNVTSS